MNIRPMGLAVVTGASSGIGAIYADRLARRGYDLLLVARNTRRMDKLARRLADETGRKIEVMTADRHVGPMWPGWSKSCAKTPESLCS